MHDDHLKQPLELVPLSDAAKHLQQGQQIVRRGLHAGEAAAARTVLAEVIGLDGTALDALQVLQVVLGEAVFQLRVAAGSTNGGA